MVVQHLGYLMKGVLKMIKIEQLTHVEFAGDEAMASSLLPEIIGAVLPKYEAYKAEYLEAWRRGTTSLPHYDGEKRFKFDKKVLISIDIYDTGEGFFTRGPWIKIKGWASRTSSTPLFTVKALIE